MNDRRESDSRVVPAKLANKAGLPAAELVEGRRLDEGNTDRQNALRTQGREVCASSALDRVRRVASKDRDARFTALLHHVSVERLRAAYRALSPRAAAGVDEVTWQDYGKDLEENLRGLHAHPNYAPSSGKPQPQPRPNRALAPPANAPATCRSFRTRPRVRPSASPTTRLANSSTCPTRSTTTTTPVTAAKHPPSAAPANDAPTTAAARPGGPRSSAGEHHHRRTKQHLPHRCPS